MAKPFKSVWTEADYAEMSWHDNHVHGLAIHAGQYGSGELELDIDYILEWLPPEDGRYRFRLAPATLRFRDVTDLRIALDYVNPTAAITPFSISAIGREERIYPNGHKTFQWSVGVNWPEGGISFSASGYTQTIRGEPIVTTEQFLTDAERGAAAL
jgi:hypothetical protein